MESKRVDRAASPQLRPLTLTFDDPELERDYLAGRASAERPVLRFGLALAALLYFSFAYLDLALVPGYVAEIWRIRALEVFVCLAILATSFLPGFMARNRSIMVLAGLMILEGILGLILLVPSAMGDRYYVALILLMIGAYTVLGMRPLDAFWLGLAGILGYLVVEGAFKHHQAATMANNFMYLGSALLLSTVGGFAAERSRRLAYFQHRRADALRELSEHDALHDPLCGVANRRLFLERLEQALARTRRYGRNLAILFIDLNDFKQVNDRFGHSFGDKVLRRAATAIAGTIREIDTLARFGGDEFVVLLEDIEDTRLAKQIAERMIERLDAPLNIAGRGIRVGVSIGISLCPQHGDQSLGLLEAADRAMYVAKRIAGSCYRFFDLGRVEVEESSV